MKVLRRLELVILAAVLLSIPAIRAGASSLTRDQQRNILVEAQQSYDRGIALLRSNPSEAHTAFRSASDRFRLVIDSGIENGRLWFNLGNAQLQAGDLGQAIASYRRAERLIPGDERLRANLAFARSLCRNRIAPSGSEALADVLLLWHHRTSSQARGLVFVTAFLLCWLMLLGRIPRPGGAWIIAATISAFIWIALGASLASDLYGFGRKPAGVVILDDVIVRKGNGGGYAPQFEQPLSQGVEFEVLEQRGDWTNIRLANGGDGWIETRAATMIEPALNTPRAPVGPLP